MIVNKNREHRLIESVTRAWPEFFVSVVTIMDVEITPRIGPLAPWNVFFGELVVWRQAFYCHCTGKGPLHDSVFEFVGVVCDGCASGAHEHVVAVVFRDVRGEVGEHFWMRGPGGRQ